MKTTEKAARSGGRWQEITRSDGRTWIPVTEDLPEPRVDVLVWLDGTQAVAVAEHCIDEDDEWWQDDDGDLSPTHWCPLPEPPQMSTSKDTGT